MRALITTLFIFFLTIPLFSTSPLESFDASKKTPTPNKEDNLNVALAGTYTIGGETADFLTFTEAVNILNSEGISDTVIFKVNQGTYNEQIEIIEFPGSDCNLPVIFKSASGNQTDVILTNNATSSNYNYTLFLNGADGIVFENITLEATGSSHGTVIYYYNQSDCNKFLGCHILGFEPTTPYTISINHSLIYSPTSDDDNNEFRDCLIENGSFGIHLNGNNSADFDTNTVIDNCTLINNTYRGILLWGLTNVSVTNNLVEATDSYALFEGFHLSDLNGSCTITDNKIKAYKGRYGFYLYNLIGTEGNEILFANNFIYIGGTGSPWTVHGDGATYGIYLHYGEYINFYHNNINTTSPDLYNGYAFYKRNGSNLSILNNIFSNQGGGYSIYHENTNGILISDYNDLYTAGTVLAYWNQDFPDLPSYQLANGLNMNSISIDPLFTSVSDLHVNRPFLDGTGLYVADVVDDIDQDLRVDPPDIGADEFTPFEFNAGLVYIQHPETPFSSGNSDIRVAIINNGTFSLTSAEIQWTVNDILQPVYYWNGNLLTNETDTITIGSYDFQQNTDHAITTWTQSPNGRQDLFPQDDTLHVNNLFPSLEGIFTIGGSNPDFTSLRNVYNTMKNVGVSGPVTFNIRSGIYNESLHIRSYPGSSCSNPVIFKSETGDSTDVVITEESLTSSNGNYTIQLNGVSGLSFQNITIQNTGATKAQVVLMINGCNCISFLNNQLISTVDTDHYNYKNIISSFGSTNNTFANNLFINGSHAMYVRGNSNNLESGTKIINNIALNSYSAGFYLDNQEAVSVSNNTIITNSIYPEFKALNFLKSRSGFEIINNKVNIENSGTGFYFDDVNGTDLNKGLIANNFVSINGTHESNGINLVLGEHLNFYNNSINIFTTDSLLSSAFQKDQANNISLLNNIFANHGGGLVMHFSNTNEIISSDYNNLFTNGSSIGFWNNGTGTIPDLDTWRSTTQLDSNSLSVDPRFISPTDLHINSGGLENAGTPIPEITTDIDGEVRDIDSPDIGADERPCLSNLVLQNETISGSQTFRASSMIEVSNVTFEGTGIITLMAPMVMVSNDIILGDGVMLMIIEEDGCN